jgi:hypothetical protein
LQHGPNAHFAEKPDVQSLYCEKKEAARPIIPAGKTQ